ncbi:MAG TPA: hypothetical protein VGL93_30130 [Streptosporangiaceae bacterium]|jgi:hypothetical protein
MEYLALGVLAAVILAGLAATGVGGTVASGCTAVLCRIVGGKNCPFAAPVHADAAKPAGPVPQRARTTAAAYPGPRPPIPRPTCDPNTKHAWTEGLHAHNDYENKHPLDDALHHGAVSVEADVWADRNGRLWVSHADPAFQCGRDPHSPCRSPGARGTLRDLYTKKLAARARQNGGPIYAGRDQHFQLVIEQKQKQDPAAWRAITREVKELPPSVDVVVSGGRPKNAIGRQPPNVTFDTPAAPGCKIPPRLDPASPHYNAAYARNFTVINAQWNSQFGGQGCGDKNKDGKISPGEQRSLDRFVAKAHRDGYKLRFWGGPDGTIRINGEGGFVNCLIGYCSAGQRRDAWRAQRKAGVDFLSTHHLTMGEEYLRSCSNVR